MDSPSYTEVLAALAPAERDRVQRSVMRMRVYGGVGCAPSGGVGSWLSQAVRSIVQPIANIVAPGTPVTAAVNTLFPAQQAAAQAAPAAAPATNYTPLILGALGAGALVLLATKRR